MALKLIRNFGHLLTNLHIEYRLFYVNCFGYNFNYNYPHCIALCKEIELYLEEYCSESLRQISIQGSKYSDRHRTLENIKKPFNNVETVYVEKCRFNSEKLPINEVFPSVRTLKLGCNTYDNPSVIRAHFPSVQHLWFHDKNFLSGYGTFQEEDIEEMLKLNPQLKTSLLYLVDNYSRNFTTRLKEYFPNVQFLQNGRTPYNHSFFSFDAFRSEYSPITENRNTFTDITESHGIKISNKYKSILDDLYTLYWNKCFVSRPEKKISLSY